MCLSFFLFFYVFCLKHSWARCYTWPAGTIGRDKLLPVSEEEGRSTRGKEREKRKHNRPHGIVLQNAWCAICLVCLLVFIFLFFFLEGAGRWTGLENNWKRKERKLKKEGMFVSNFADVLMEIFCKVVMKSIHLSTCFQPQCKGEAVNQRVCCVTFKGVWRMYRMQCGTSQEESLAPCDLYSHLMETWHRSSYNLD